MEKKCCIESCKSQFEHKLRRELNNCGHCLQTIKKGRPHNYHTITPCDMHKEKYNLSDFGGLSYRDPKSNENEIMHFHFNKYLRS